MSSALRPSSTVVAIYITFAITLSRYVFNLLAIKYLRAGANYERTNWDMPSMLKQLPEQ